MAICSLHRVNKTSSTNEVVLCRGQVMLSCEAAAEQPYALTTSRKLSDSGGFSSIDALRSAYTNSSE